jgi:hypothetical protein
MTALINIHAYDTMMQHATEYLIDDLKVLSASYAHGNDYAKSEIANVSEAINILDRLRSLCLCSAVARTHHEPNRLA